MLSAHQLNRQRGGDDQEGPRLLLQAIYAQAGVFNNAPAKSANDLAAALLFLLFIWALNCAKYRALLSITAQNSTIFFQTDAPPFSTHHPANTRTIASFPSQGQFFPPAPAMCQMNTPLTLHFLAHHGGA